LNEKSLRLSVSASKTKITKITKITKTRLNFPINLRIEGTVRAIWDGSPPSINNMLCVPPK
jgi:hypothetical protein